jgi:hypothetical protein
VCAERQVMRRAVAGEREIMAHPHVLPTELRGTRNRRHACPLTPRPRHRRTGPRTPSGGRPSVPFMQSSQFTTKVSSSSLHGSVEININCPSCCFNLKNPRSTGQQLFVAGKQAENTGQEAGARSTTRGLPVPQST